MTTLLKSVLIFSLLGLTGCEDHENPLAYQKNTHGRGKVVILVEESFKPLFETSIDTFESLFPKANIVAEYKGETDIIKDFYANKSKTICISRDFTAAEKKQLLKQQVEVQSDKVAIDGVALIIHPDNKDTLITVAKLKSLLTAKSSKWPSTGEEISIVFDQLYSANFNYLIALTKTKSISKNVFAAKSNEEVIKYVKNNKNAIGVIGLNWISDEEDFEALNFLDGIKVMSVSKTEKGEYFKPYQGFIYTKEYPLTRDMWLINKGGRSSLNTGFVIFMIGDKGQTLVQKSELVPAKAPVRLIQMSTE
jgi:phosphate transport system substrate-binding protein